jgi:putative glutamine amidotransferase
MNCVIGLTAYLDPASWGPWHRPAALLPQSYVDGVLAGGGVPVLLPVQVPSGAAAALRGLDGLVLTGGADVDPSHYGATPGPHTASRPDRDEWELALVGAALDRGLPILAICRGLQLLNVALGGTLHQHLPDILDNTGHQHVPDVLGSTAHEHLPDVIDPAAAPPSADDAHTHCPAPGVFGTNDVRTAPGSLAAKLLGHTATASCHHHQAIDTLGAGLVATAWSPDGTIEAVEHPGHPFVFAVQWHPEEDPTDTRLFTALIDACVGRAASASGRAAPA